MKFGIVVFPGSNGDRDCYDATYRLLGEETRYIWHEDTDIADLDCIILPGGFSYGDYLRAGAIAKTSPIIRILESYVDQKIIIGICNGFQILTEAGLLPGTLLKNRSLKFICTDVYLKIMNHQTPCTIKYCQDQILTMPIAHAEGNYFITEEELQELRQNRQILLTYVTDKGIESDLANPNGSIANIAGVCSKSGMTIGLMPHPERNLDQYTGNGEGLLFFQSIVEFIANRKLTYV